MIAEYCLLYGGTPKEALSIPIKLFFAMIASGKKIQFRKRMRTFYELCNISRISNLTQEGQTELMQLYWDCSLDENDMKNRDQFIEEVNEKKPVVYAPPSAILDFFRGKHG